MENVQTKHQDPYVNYTMNTNTQILYFASRKDNYNYLSEDTEI